MNSDDLKKHMQPHFEIFEGLDVYFWIAGGSIKDFFISKSRKIMTPSLLVTKIKK